MNKIIIIIILILICFLSCTGKVEKNRIITVTIEPQRYFAEQLSGGLFKIVTMVPAGTSPETYDPSPVQMTDLAKSSAYFQIGKIGFEEVWMDKIRKNNPGLPVFDNGSGISYIISAEDHDQDHSDHSDHRHHAHAGGVDPHTWSSPKEALKIAENMCKTFIEIDKENEKTYMENLKRLKTEILKTDSIVTELISKVSCKSFIIYHPALTYFARDYGLNQLCMEINGKEPSPEQFRLLIETARSGGVKTIFIQQEFDRKNAEIIAAETGCKLTIINPLSYYWSEETIKIAKALSDETYE
ncbi:zinc ABC transporter substrate-binding protein [Bacteroidia bacterium]|nr:zinc ABC transporter substrate-binding protein [Bacteroidia bacterium]GHV22637.1 zinc ABC transporter substrate-binding protein [Bacteroidia bacterium]